MTGSGARQVALTPVAPVTEGYGELQRDTKYEVHFFWEHVEFYFFFY